jgi:hypothetical protein
MSKKNPSDPKTKKTTYRVQNWREYNASLVQRGAITIWIAADEVTAWTPGKAGKRGGQYRYSDAAIECALTIKSVYHLPLRATEGFLRSWFELTGFPLPVPDYSTLSRRAAHLKVKLPRRVGRGLHLVIDSWGLKVYGEGEWKVRQHGYSQRRTWRKFHISVDERSLEIQEVTLTEAGSDDASQVADLLAASDEVDQVSADGSYDKRKVYRACQEQGVKRIAIPPRRDAHLWQQGNCQAPPHPRDVNLRRIRAIGRKAWKVEVGYHRRSLAETTVYRFKIMFGHTLSARLLPQQRTEVRVKCAILNRMAHLGLPDSVPIPA